MIFLFTYEYIVRVYDIIISFVANKYYNCKYIKIYRCIIYKKFVFIEFDELYLNLSMKKIAQVKLSDEYIVNMH